ncbi:DUF427 domain-containing protein [Pseudonocardia sp. KRD-184]|uniref:DUF427 domain-containing protein n=1 Tax=Pseudonocardia oceani TaxID=2792013 RepID=A0ABS6UGA9_9PSEU|nr:DUF427 domain-containing protein [Pseudonocardia oceani]MBW0089441.1 DUF427 domain-containing protein [Pseudonocardia oceani]MBW0096447.1 DUF427 domain-containing protein [Pseudonocardia oceani]MBW0108764.1 DUF427 domain-containing protein [Pseudonocardia oceani]MBW0122992.1 DUF427 domain-containing protein [Pseudonocardia oceani]MBW0131265.1 DUF427 domain-containing protein [Pseudonocardia oceani]
MSITMAGGPLATDAPEAVNYRMEGPEHRLFLGPFPRRVRGVLNGRTVLDTQDGALLHETGRLPQLYVPQIDVAGHLLEAGETVEHCPFKGEARFSTLVVDGARARDAVWSFPQPAPGAGWLRGYHGVAFDALDAWYDEAEQVRGHLRDPYHRVDTRPTDRRVRVSVGRTVLAETAHAVLLSETGLPNRLYVPPGDVHADALTPSTTTSHCPYKGDADYAGASGTEDVAWRYREPFPDAVAVAGHWCFDETRVRVESDTRSSPAERGHSRSVRPRWL